MFILRNFFQILKGKMQISCGRVKFFRTRLDPWGRIPWGDAFRMHRFDLWDIFFRNGAKHPWSHHCHFYLTPNQQTRIEVKCLIKNTVS